MSQLNYSTLLQGAFAAGVSIHLSIFRIGEWDLWAVRILLSFVSLYSLAILMVFRYSPEHNTPIQSVKAVSGVFISLLSGLFSSLLLYRGFFHRLRHFPGPFPARFSNFYLTFLTAKKFQLCDEVKALHQQYGEIVRLGPSKLSINSADALHKIHSAQSTCSKGPWYDILSPVVSLQMIRDKQEHIHRRRVWDRGFSAKALRDYEPRVVAYTDQLLAHFDSSQGKPINVTDWFNFYSFDVMGDLAWGKSFNMLKDGQKHYFMKSLHTDMTSVGLFSHAPWLFPIFKATPGLNAENKRFWKWVNSQVTERRAIHPSQPDVFSWLLEDHEKKKATAQDELNLAGDAHLIAVAGSDTTAATLTCLFFELASHPECLSTLQAEIDGAFSGSDPVDSAALRSLGYLNAIIDETLRLHPPVPSGVQRMTSSKGMTIGDVVIPGNTIIQVPSYTLARDERYFGRPDDFVPERWTTQPQLVKDSRAFAPFSIGRYSCIGKQLGLMEVRHVVSQILRRYDVVFEPGASRSAFLDGKMDTFTLQLPPLNLVFSKRREVPSAVVGRS